MSFAFGSWFKPGQYESVALSVRAKQAEIDRLRSTLEHIAGVDHWLDDDLNERVAYLQRCAREALRA